MPVKNAYLDLTGNTDALSSDANIRAAVQSEINSGRYPMAIKKGDNYFGVLYQFTEGTEVIIQPYSTWNPLSTSSGIREPDVVTEYDNDTTYLNQVNGILNTSYSTSADFKSALQAEYNQMVKNVEDKGGFWVGRYETSNMSNSTTQVQVGVKKNQNTGINNVTWYRMYAQQKIYAKKAISGNANLQSSMIWGSQWDQIMIWMRGEPNGTGHYITNGVGMGNYGSISGVNDGWSSTSSPASTGYQETYRVRNIYDLAGNLYEWTLEATDPNIRVFRRRRLP